MTTKKLTLGVITVLALILAVGVRMSIANGNGADEPTPDNTPSLSTTPTPTPTIEPLLLEAGATGGESKATLTVTSNRAVSGTAVLQDGSKKVAEKQFTTTVTRDEFGASVKFEKVPAGTYEWAVTVDGEVKTAQGKVIVKAPAPTKDYCPSGDYTGNRYDGKCGSKPAPKPAPKPASKAKDTCPRGDYTGSRYDGKCGKKPASGNNGGGTKPKPKCKQNQSLVGPDSEGNYVCWNNTQH